MTERKFTPPREFFAEYVDGNGDKVLLFKREPLEEFPLIGFNADGERSWTECGRMFLGSASPYDLHDIPEVTAELEEGETEAKKYQDAWLEVEIAELEAKLANAVIGLKTAEARIEELEAKLAEADRALDISCVLIEKLMEDKGDAE